MKKLLIIFILLIAANASAAVLSWDKNPDAVSYSVYVRDAGQTDADYKLVQSGITATSLTFTPTVHDKNYEYSVKAVNIYGCSSSAYSDPVPFNEAKAQTVGKVTGLKIVVTVVLDPLTGR